MVIVTPVLVLTMCLLVTWLDAAVFPPDFEAKLQSYIDVTMRCRHVPGLTLAVVKDSEVWTRGYGTADFTSGRQVDETTLFNIGSVTKSFTMTLLGILLTEQGLDWTVKVRDLFPPGYKFIDDFRTRELTVKDLLCHRTGLANLDLGWVAGIPSSVSRTDMCKRLAYLPESKPVRDAFIYNNFLYMMLGHAAEAMGGDSWEYLMNLMLFRSIGMTSTRFLTTPTDVLQNDVAHPYIYGENDTNYRNSTLEIYSLHPLEPAGAIMSNAVDMAKYLKFQMEKGKTANGFQLLDKNLLSEAYGAKITGPEFQTPKQKFFTKPDFPISDSQLGYGYAWVDSTYRGYRRFWHTGGLFSYKSIAMIFPEKNIAMYGSVNGPDFRRDGRAALDTITYYIADHLLGERPWLNETTTCTFPEPWSRKKVQNTTTTRYITASVQSLKQYTGSFGNNLMPGINITVAGSQLVAAIGSNLRGVLHKTSMSDSFDFEMTHPVELTMQYGDDNRDTIKKFKFNRANMGDVTSCTVTYDVDVTYTKTTSMFHIGDGTSGFVG